MLVRNDFRNFSLYLQFQYVWIKYVIYKTRCSYTYSRSRGTNECLEGAEVLWTWWTTIRIIYVHHNCHFLPAVNKAVCRWQVLRNPAYRNTFLCVLYGREISSCNALAFGITGSNFCWKRCVRLRRETLSFCLPVRPHVSCQPSPARFLWNFVFGFLLKCIDAFRFGCKSKKKPYMKTYASLWFLCMAGPCAWEKTCFVIGCSLMQLYTAVL